MKNSVIGYALSTVLLFSGCGGGSSSSSDEGSKLVTSFGTFDDCALSIEENNLYGAKPIECSSNVLDSGWNISSIEVKNSDGFNGNVHFWDLSFKNATIEDPYYYSETNAYSIVDGEDHGVLLTVYGKNVSTGELGEMDISLNIRGVAVGYNSVATTHTYPVLILRLNLTDANASKSATNLNNIAFGFGLDQVNFAMLRNSASTRSFVPVVENEGVSNDGVITVSIDEASFVSGDYHNIDSVNRYIKKAVEQADQYVDFNSYDLDGDGILTEKELSIVVSFPQDGGFDNVGFEGVSMPILSDYSYVSDDGVQVLYRSSPSTNYVDCMTEVVFSTGTFFHEQGHTVWNLVDLYDTDYSSQGTGNIGLMDSGSHTYNGSIASPSIMMAYSQVLAGFLTPIEVNATQTVTLYPATMNSSHNIIKVVSERPTEFFYLENYLFSDVRPKPEQYYLSTDEKIGGVLITRINTATGVYDNHQDNNRIVDVVAPTYDSSGNIDRKFFNEDDSISDVKYSDGTNSGISFENIIFNGDGSITLDIVVQLIIS